MLPGYKTDSSTLGHAGSSVADASSRVGTNIKKPVNFSRLTGYSEEGSVRAVQAYYGPDSVLPADQEKLRIALVSSPEQSQLTSGIERSPLSEEWVWNR